MNCPAPQTSTRTATFVELRSLLLPCAPAQRKLLTPPVEVTKKTAAYLTRTVTHQGCVTVTHQGYRSDGTLTSWALRIAVKGYARGTLSTDATLTGLSLGTGVTLSPTFASGTTIYTASVATAVDEVTITSTTNHASARVRIPGRRPRPSP